MDAIMRKIKNLHFVYGFTANSFLLMILLFVSGCQSTTNSFTDVQPVKIQELKWRPLNIEFDKIFDNRVEKLELGSDILAVLIPLYPYGIMRTEDSGPPQKWLNKPFNKKLNENLDFLPYQNDQRYVGIRFVPERGMPWSLPTYAIPALLCRYLNSSKAVSGIYFEGRPFTNQEAVLSIPLEDVPQVDIKVQMHLDKFEEWIFDTFYGLTGFVGLGTLTALNGEEKGVDYKFTFKAIEAGSGKTIITRTYEKSVSSSFYPFFGLRAQYFNSVDIASPSIHDACKDFVTELDKVLPSDSDKAYWEGVIKARNERIAVAAAKLKSSNPASVQSPEFAKPATQNDKPINIPVANLNMPGTLYALVIGNDNYQRLPKLSTAISDAEEVAKTLGNDYGFNVTLMKNATRAQTLKALYEFRKLGQNDSLLIYYAGHGWLDTKADEGYWLPVDASRDDNVDWIQNANITAETRACNAKHILIVADSCYSGKLVRGVQVVNKAPDYFQKLSEKKARMVMSSGGLEPVVDSSGKGKHSVFASAFLDALNSNTSTIDGLSFFTKIREKVGWNADQIPEYGVIHKSGHDGGDFIFIRKNTK